MYTICIGDSFLEFLMQKFSFLVIIITLLTNPSPASTKNADNNQYKPLKKVAIAIAMEESAQYLVRQKFPKYAPLSPKYVSTGSTIVTSVLFDVYENNGSLKREHIFQAALQGGATFMADTIVDSTVRLLNTTSESIPKKTLITLKKNQPAIKIAKKALGLFFMYGIPMIWDTCVNLTFEDGNTSKGAADDSFDKSNLSINANQGNTNIDP